MGKARERAERVSTAEIDEGVTRLRGYLHVMRSWNVVSEAAPGAAWRLLAEPRRWHEWSPHVSGAWRLGAPEVRAGAHGAVRVFGLLPVPARILAVEPGTSWTWRVGPDIVMVHRVERDGIVGDGCRIVIELTAPGPLEQALAAVYGPVIALSLRRLARRAARGEPA